jgi:hypothetical protein
MGNFAVFNFSEQKDLLNEILWLLLFGPSVRHAARPCTAIGIGMFIGSNGSLALVFIARKAINTGAIHVDIACRCIEVHHLREAKNPRWTLATRR